MPLPKLPRRFVGADGIRWHRMPGDTPWWQHIEHGILADIKTSRGRCMVHVYRIGSDKERTLLSTAVISMGTFGYSPSGSSTTTFRVAGELIRHGHTQSA